MHSMTVNIRSPFAANIWKPESDPSIDIDPFETVADAAEILATFGLMLEWSPVLRRIVVKQITDAFGDRLRRYL